MSPGVGTDEYSEEPVGEAPIESPCVRICIVDGGRGLCIGCLRTLPEIAAWGSLSPERRREIMAELPSRGVRPASPQQSGA